MFPFDRSALRKRAQIFNPNELSERLARSSFLFMPQSVLLEPSSCSLELPSLDFDLSLDRHALILELTRATMNSCNCTHICSPMPAVDSPEVTAKTRSVRLIRLS